MLRLWFKIKNGKRAFWHFVLQLYLLGYFPCLIDRHVDLFSSISCETRNVLAALLSRIMLHKVETSECVESES